MTWDCRPCVRSPQGQGVAVFLLLSFLAGRVDEFLIGFWLLMGMEFDTIRFGLGRDYCMILSSSFMENYNYVYCINQLSFLVGCPFIL